MNEEQARVAAGGEGDQPHQSQGQNPRSQRDADGSHQRLGIEGLGILKPPDSAEHGEGEHNPKAMAPPTRHPECRADNQRQDAEYRRKLADIGQDFGNHQFHARTLRFAWRTIATCRRRVNTGKRLVQTARSS